MSAPGSLTRALNSVLPAATLRKRPLPEVPQISLWVIDLPPGRIDAQTAATLMDKPPYWCLCWGAGQALAWLILHGAIQVADRSVIDLGCGSGIVGIAAALAGATRVTCVDNDPVALQATAENIKLNSVSLNMADSLEHLDHPEHPDRCDLLFAADLFYDRSNLGLLPQLRQLADRIIVGDARLSAAPASDFTLLHTRTSGTFPDFGASEFHRVQVWQA